MGPGSQRKDKNGETYWLHALNQAAITASAPEPWPSVPEAANPDIVARVYGGLLDRLDLVARHREELLARGFTDEEINRAGYRTLPLRGRSAPAKSLESEHGPKACAGTPGLIQKSKGGKTWATLAGSPGLLIPLRDRSRRVLALQIRRDEVRKKQPRYMFLSSSNHPVLSSLNHAGPKPISGVHVPLFEGETQTIRLTEGPLKADFATFRTGVLTLGVAGAGRWREALPTIQGLAPAQVLVAFDADWRSKPNVARALSDACQEIASAGFAVAAEIWPQEAGKGIDDLLQVGGEPEVIGPDRLPALLREAEKVVNSHGEAGHVDGVHSTSATDPSAPQAPKKGHEFPRTDAGQADYLLLQYGRDLRHCAPLKTWIIWDGSRWAPDRTGAVQEKALDAARDRERDAFTLADHERRRVEINFAITCQNAARRRAVVDTASIIQAVNVLPEALDPDPWLLNCRNGTVDLRTGELRSHRREDMLTKLSPVSYSPDATCPLWDAYLARVMDGNQGLIDYLQRAAGYSLTGSTREEVFFILHGGGRNGKGTFTRTVAELLGEWADTLPFDLLSAARNQGDGPSPHLAKLPGVRMLLASEGEESLRLGEAFVKEITGGDQITACAKYRDPIRFLPQFKLWLSSNHRPEIRGTDDGIWSRIHLVPFFVTIPPSERDGSLKEKLHAELPGILSWAVRGCIEWLRIGLQPPPEVLSATEEYRRESDRLAEFLAERCIIHRDVSASAAELFGAYKAWAETAGEKSLTQKAFGTYLTGRGFHRAKSGIYFWSGLKLRPHGSGPGFENPDVVPRWSSESQSSGRRASESFTDDAYGPTNTDSRKSHLISSPGDFLGGRSTRSTGEQPTFGLDLPF